MRLGVIADIHGNRLALEAVVADGRDVGVESWWALGDLASVGPEPAETLELLVDLPGLRAVRGNGDRYLVTGERPRPHADDVRRDPALLPVLVEVEASFAWTHGALAATGWLPWLAELPFEQRSALPDGTRLLGVHSSPHSDADAGITPDMPDADQARVLAGADAEIVCAGHTHRPTDRWVDGLRAVNPGSVSNPLTADLRASYAVVDADRHGTAVTHRRVAYDHDEVVRRIWRSGHPCGRYIADHQTGRHVRFDSVL